MTLDKAARRRFGSYVFIIGSLLDNRELVFHGFGEVGREDGEPVNGVTERAFVCRTQCGRIRYANRWRDADGETVPDSYRNTDNALPATIERALVIARPCRNCWPQ